MLTKHLFAAGFSAQLVQMMVDNLPEDVDNMDDGMDWVRSVLATNLPVMEDEDSADGTRRRLRADGPDGRRQDDDHREAPPRAA